MFQFVFVIDQTLSFNYFSASSPFTFKHSPVWAINYVTALSKIKYFYIFINSFINLFLFRCL